MIVPRLLSFCVQKRHEISEANTWHELTLMTSSSEDLHSTDSEMSVTALFSSIETTLMGTATVFPVRIAVFRISVSCTQNKAQCCSETERDPKGKHQLFSWTYTQERCTGSQWLMT